MPTSSVELDSREKLEQHLKDRKPLTNCEFQALDVTSYPEFEKEPLTDSVFLGCKLTPDIAINASNSGAIVFPRPSSVPYDTFRSQLYTVEELYKGYVTGQAGSYQKSFDAIVFKHFHDTGDNNPPSAVESLYRRMHDHGVSDALEEYITKKKVVAIMGGHKIGRDKPEYLGVARIARELTNLGFLVISGGGPGAMEAANLGAWFAKRPLTELEAAVGILKTAPGFENTDAWLDTAFKVRQTYPIKDVAGSQSLGIPTWLYGHEPPNTFATVLAKYFANSEREDGLLAIATYGVIFAPGSAGTIQEVFQDAAQNHYKSVPPKIASPMIFFGEGYWKWNKPVFPLLAQLAAGMEYASLLMISDSETDIIKRIAGFKVP